MLKVIESAPPRESSVAAPGRLLDELVGDGARAMLASALEAEVADYIDAHAQLRDGHGRRLVVRNGRAVPRAVRTAAGAVQVHAPRVNDRRVDEFSGERRRFASSILPAWARRSPQIGEVLPLLYLDGLSSLDFVPALEQFLGSSAGLSAATVTRLTAVWQQQAVDFAAFGTCPSGTTSRCGLTASTSTSVLMKTSFAGW